MFYFVDELKLVDWDTIAVYTCQNLQCLPDFASGQHYSAEFGYIQVSEDFANVRYGDAKEIEAQRKFNQKIMEQQEKQMEEEATEALKKIEEDKEQEQECI